MEHRDSILPLIVSLALALGVHLAALAGYALIDTAPAAPIVKPVPPAADLTVTDLRADEPRTAGEPASIHATVRNAGDAPAEGFDVELLIDGRPVARYTQHDSVAPGGAFDHTFVHTIAEPGVHQVRIVVDPAEAIDESDESNNELEDLFVWLAPETAGSEASLPDLAVAAFVVPEPRIAGEPARLLGKIANLGAATEGPVVITAVVDGEPIGVVSTDGPIPTGGVVGVQLPFTVAEPGEHEITLVADPGESIEDTNRENNQLTRIVTFNPQTKEMKVGQLEASPVDINWISIDDYQELLARKSRFDQATSQREIDPVKNAPTPRDPTPPAPRPSPNPSQPQPEAVAVVPDPATPMKIVEPSPRPEKPTQPDVPIDPSETEPREAPPMTRPTPDVEAAAPVQGDPVDPVRIDPTDVLDKLPNPVVDGKPNKPDVEPMPAPPATGTPDREVALLTPPIKPEPGTNPLLPDFTPKTDKVDDETMRKAPDKPVDPDADPAEKSAKVDADDKGDTVASLPLEPKPDEKPVSPTDKPMTKAEPDRETKQPDKPKEVKEPTDGSETVREQEPTVAVKPSPANPAASPNESRPTSAPKTEREADPVTRIESLVVRPGKVVARNGLKINTVAARFSPIARRTSLPANPIVVLTFDKTGKVVNAKFRRSTGFDNVDGPLLTAFYKWTAEGPLLEHVAKTWDVEIHVLLGVE